VTAAAAGTLTVVALRKSHVDALFNFTANQLMSGERLVKAFG
jgi:hypothetical protein